MLDLHTNQYNLVKIIMGSSKRHRGEFAGLRNVEINSRQIILTQNYDSVLTACPGKSTKIAIACINRF